MKQSSRGLRLALFLGLVTVAGGIARAQQHTPAEASPATQARGLLERWISLEQQRSALETQWQQSQSRLLLRKQLLLEEKAQLETALESSSDSNDDVEAERQRLLEKQETLEQEQARLRSSLDRLWPELRATLPRLPPPLASAWRQRLAGIDSTDTPLSEQLDAVLGLLRSLQDFQQRISRHESIITLEDGQTLLAQQLYLGASQGWFVTADGRYRGQGYANDAGWQWRIDPDVDAATVSRALAMLDNNQDIDFVTLPASVPRREASP